MTLSRLDSFMLLFTYFHHRHEKFRPIFSMCVYLICNLFNRKPKHFFSSVEKISNNIYPYAHTSSRIRVVRKYLTWAQSGSGERYLYAKIENPHPQYGMMQEINKRHRIMFDLTFIVQFIAHDKTTLRKNQDIIEDDATFLLNLFSVSRNWEREK